jgi:hypothetical protein
VQGAVFDLFEELTAGQSTACVATAQVGGVEVPGSS